MIGEKIGFYQEVEVCSGAKNSKYRGLKGAVLGVSEEEGVVYGYVVLIHGESSSVYFDKNDLIPTGFQFSRDDFY
ncbi:Imm31 family immunity protein [Pseudomonas sp. zfem001]|uniref:Imm31 family immunity protein n=1 Tax=Pseudomonas sp. zfem001 TaxID=3078196 RepID=UPI0029277E9A|nr:Imm31 family immunity protein [Pseudomonas sp. zfem001]MDU9407345.1 Imm31 family immunity protein [Pseudomonas sp. zfem001]